MPLSQNQGDAWTVTSAYLDRFVEEQRLLAAKRTSRRKRGAGPLSALHVADRTTRRRDAPGAGRQRRIRRFHAGTDPARGRAALDRGCQRARRTRLRHLEATARRRSRESDRPLVDQLLAQRASLARSPRRAASAGYRRPEHPPPWRFPSRPDADRQGRHLHHRFRGRAPPPAGRAPAQGAGGARRRRPDPLDRLFGHRRAGARAQGGARRARQAWRGAGGMARPFGRGVPCRLSRDHDRSAAVAGRIRRPPSGC